MEIKLSSNDIDFPAYYIHPGSKKAPAIILIHEIWGLNDNIRDIAQRLKKEGYAVLAPDLMVGSGFEKSIGEKLFAQMNNPQTRNEAQKKLRELFAPINSPEFAAGTIAKLRTCFEYLKSQKNLGTIASIGFCFGGTYSFYSAITLPLNAAIVFYGRTPEPSDKLKEINCPLHAFYGEEDKDLVLGVTELEKKMREYGKEFSYTIYPDAGHAFFNDQNKAMYRKTAADDSWKKVLSFLSENMKETYGLKTSVMIKADVSKVWEALTKPELVKKYFFGVEVITDWKEKSSIIYRGIWQGKAFEDKGIVLKVEKNKLLVSTYWSGFSGLADIPENYQQVEYHLKSTKDGTELSVIAHNIKTKKMRDHSEKNWQIILEGLKTMVEGEK